MFCTCLLDLWSRMFSFGQQQRVLVTGHDKRWHGGKRPRLLLNDWNCVLILINCSSITLCHFMKSFRYTPFVVFLFLWSEHICTLNLFKNAVITCFYNCWIIIVHFLIKSSCFTPEPAEIYFQSFLSCLFYPLKQGFIDIWILCAFSLFCKLFYVY